MSTPTLVESLHSANAGGSTSVVTASGTAIDDILLLFIGVGGSDLAHALAPTSTPSVTFNLVDQDELVSPAGGMLRVYWGKVTTGGAHTVNAPSNGGFNTLLAVSVLRGANTTTPIDAGDVTIVNTSTAAPASPSISPASADARLFCATLSGDGANNTLNNAPAGMSSLGGDSAFGTLTTAQQVLSSSGATGTRVWDFTTNRRWVVASVAVKGPSGSTVTGTGVTDLGALTATAIGTPKVLGVGVSNLGALTGTATGTPKVVGTGVAALGALTGTATGTPKVLGTGVTDLGALNATATGTPKILGTGAADLGALNATAAGSVKVTGSGVTDLGGLTGHGTGQGQFTATGAADLGALTATATGSKIVSGQAISTLGALSASAVSNDIFRQMIAADLYRGTLAVKLLQCLCEAAAANPSPPANCCFRVGTDVAQDMGGLVDLCCQGLGYVALGDSYPSSESFPNQDQVRQANANCAPPSWAIVFKIGLMRCAPVGDQNFPPSCDDWNQAALQNLYDTKTLTQASCCFRDFVVSDSEMMAGMSVVLDRQVQASPNGGCIERAMQITVQIPNCDC